MRLLVTRRRYCLYVSHKVSLSHKIPLMATRRFPYGYSWMDPRMTLRLNMSHPSRHQSGYPEPCFQQECIYRMLAENI